MNGLSILPGNQVCKLNKIQRRNLQDLCKQTSIGIEFLFICFFCPMMLLRKVDFSCTLKQNALYALKRKVLSKYRKEPIQYNLKSGCVQQNTIYTNALDNFIFIFLLVYIQQCESCLFSGLLQIYSSANKWRNKLTVIFIVILSIQKSYCKNKLPLSVLLTTPVIIKSDQIFKKSNITHHYLCPLFTFFISFRMDNEIQSLSFMSVKSHFHFKILLAAMFGFKSAVASAYLFIFIGYLF